MNTHNQTVVIVFIFLLVAFSIQLFEARFLQQDIVIYLSFIYIFTAIVISSRYMFPEINSGFVLPVQLICVSVVLSILMAYLSWGQSIMDSIKSTIPYMVWFFFYYLVHKKVSIKSIEKIILIYGVIYLILYFFQLVNSDTIYFGWQDNLIEERGIVRIIFPSGGVFFLASFMALNKITTQRDNRWFWSILALLGILIPFLQATRQFIAGTLLIYLYHFIKDQKYYKKIIILIFFIGFVLYIANSNIPIIKGLITVQEETTGLGEEYIRVLAGTYFLSDFFPDNISRVLGNGVPYGIKSVYGNFVITLQQERGYYLTDIGIIAGYVMFGIIFVWSYILIWYKSFTIPLPKEYYYLKYYLWFLLITCMTSLSVYHPHYLISTVFVLYIYQYLYNDSLNINPTKKM
jgi:hypothetical protein